MKRKAAVVGFVIFLAIDVALFVAVRKHVEHDPVVSDAGTSAPQAPSTSPSSDVTASPTGRASLALSSSGILAKVWRGQCVKDGRPRLEISSDLGKTFEEIALPLLDDVEATAGPGERADMVRTILMVQVESPDEITIVASNKECKAQRFDTTDHGESWTEADPGDVWYVDAAGTGVVSPEGASEPGCDVVALSPLSDRNAKVACSDGTILGTDDNGDEWVTLGELGDIGGLTIPTLRDGFAVAPDDDCESRAFVTTDAGGEWEPAGCIAKNGEGTSLVGGPRSLLALVGDEVHLSTDAGKSWSRQSAE